MHRQALWSLLSGMSFSFLVASCDDIPTVFLTAEDFRFVPDFVRVPASVPLSFSVYNAGRESHEFDSPILFYAATPVREQTKKSGRPGIEIEPGRSIRLVIAPPPGTYLFICRRKGHAGMTGTLIVE